MITALDQIATAVPDFAKAGGLHHLCFRSDNIQQDMARLKDKGYQFPADAPTPGAHGSKVIFIHPRSCDGVLIKINQPGGPGGSSSKQTPEEVI